MADFKDWSSPTTFQQDQIASDPVTIGGTDYSVDLYASVQIRVSCVDLAFNTAVLFQFKSATGVIIDQGLLSIDELIASGVWELPVVGPILNISKQMAGNQQATIYGSNMPIPGKRMLQDYASPRGLVATVPSGTATLTRTALAASTSGLPAIFSAVTGFNGECMLVATIFGMGGATEWDFQAEILNLDGTFSVFNVFKLTAVGTSQTMFPHPRAYTRWWVRNVGATTSSASLELDVHPNALA